MHKAAETVFTLIGACTVGLTVAWFAEMWEKRRPVVRDPDGHWRAVRRQYPW